ncbi:hypothetical protein COPEUT_02632 [Coprococcus eutactus ATCC 27759]|nr:hypothetical protein COPEUT_02632 [Coprococcus eutactus ATCC 27759]
MVDLPDIAVSVMATDKLSFIIQVHITAHHVFYYRVIL